MRIVALDLSLTATGVAHADRDQPPATRLVETEAKQFNGTTARIAWVRDTIVNLTSDADLVVIEEPVAYGMKSMSAVDVAGLNWVVRMALHDLGIRFVDVNNSTAKTYSTGSGRAKKHDILAAAIRRLGYGGSSSDEADALWLLEMARDHYELVRPRVPETHRKALAKIEWPAAVVSST